jgi:hypothetical protein
MERKPGWRVVVRARPEAGMKRDSDRILSASDQAAINIETNGSGCGY